MQDDEADTNAADKSKAVETGTGKVKEATQEKIENFSRVLPSQLEVLDFDPAGRYQPIRPRPRSSKTQSNAYTGMMHGSTGQGGICIMKDTTPGQEHTWVSLPDLTPPPVTMDRPGRQFGHGASALDRTPAPARQQQTQAGDGSAGSAGSSNGSGAGAGAGAGADAGMPASFEFDFDQ